MTFGICEPDGYLPRVADMRLDDALRSSGAVHIKGPKWCGKTETGIHHTRSQIYLQDPDKSPALLAMADSKPSELLIGDKPRLVDEWQMAPQLWDAVRFAVDREKVRGGYVLTGSSTPKIRPAHTGVGRIAPLEMSTMSLLETSESTGAVSLLSLFEGTLDIAQVAGLDVDDYAHIICRGGWPEAVVSESRGDAGRMARDYVLELLDSNINEMDGIRRNRTWMRQIMRSYARNVSGQASLSTIAADMQGEPPSAPTLSEYVDALSRAFVLNDLSAWNPRLRSKTAVRTSPTRHFSDPSIAAAVLAATPRGLLDDFETFGLLFESLCIHDLRVYASALGGSLYHYRDKTGLEADAVVVLDDGRWALVEVKMGQSRIDEGAAQLLKLAERIDQTREGRPSFLMVLTSMACAYRRKDGVVVVPLACLGV